MTVETTDKPVAPEPSLRELYAAHDRLWAAFKATPLEERQEWSRKGYEGDSEACRLFRELGTLSEQIGPRLRDFEADLRTALGERLQDDDLARAAYGALCNVDWEHDDGSRYSCSWRSAGGLVADLRGRGEDYLDFYCSGNEGQVSEEVRAALGDRGWQAREIAT